MNHASCIINKRGVTLIELLVVVAVIGILIAAVGFSFQGWRGKYAVESQIKQIHIDLMNTRVRAMQLKRMHFFRCISPFRSYLIYDDTNPAPDGNRALEVSGGAIDTLLPEYPKNVEDTITWSSGTLEFDIRGYISATVGTSPWVLSINTTNDADYDCITVTETRINMGKMSGGNCGAK